MILLQYKFTYQLNYTIVLIRSFLTTNDDQMRFDEINELLKQFHSDHKCFAIQLFSINR